jgi:hypothetical protein
MPYYPPARLSAPAEEPSSLSHAIAVSNYRSVTRDADGRVSSVVVFTDAAMTTKLREILLSYSGGALATVTKRQYDGEGNLVATLSGTIDRSGGRLAGITWILS